MKIDYQEIGRRIAVRRRELHLKQSLVCEACDLSNKYLSAIECARSIPSLDVLLRLCDALDTTPDALLLGTRHDGNDLLRQEINAELRSLNEKELELVRSFLAWLKDNHLQ